ncbi:MAG: Threonine/homoserine exporter RhtA [Candidatus Erwinia impunctatus]|nr:Threonine/homoserine exporter RhtA [Culicoides impunctatus]
MPYSAKTFPVWLPVVILLIAMTSIQCGAALAKTLFPAVGATGITALRLGFGTLILCAVFRPWRLRFTRQQLRSLLFYGMALGGMNYFFYLSIRTVPLGIAVALEFVGPLTLALVSSRRIVDLLWIIFALAGLWLLLPVGDSLSNVDPVGAILALFAGALWAVYILTGKKAGAEHGPATVAVGSLFASLIFVPVGLFFADSGIRSLSVIPFAIAIAVLSTAIPYSLEMLALTRMPAKTFGTLMSMEPALAALSGMLFLNEMLSLRQWLGLLAIVMASCGTTLMLRPAKNKLRKISVVNTESPQ